MSQLAVCLDTAPVGVSGSGVLGYPERNLVDIGQARTKIASAIAALLK